MCIGRNCLKYIIANNNNAIFINKTGEVINPRIKSKNNTNYRSETKS